MPEFNVGNILIPSEYGSLQFIEDRHGVELELQEILDGYKYTGMVLRGNKNYKAGMNYMFTNPNYWKVKDEDDFSNLDLSLDI